jgi:hypothetical protein
MTQDLNEARQYVAETDAELLSYHISPFKDFEEIVRGWPSSKIPRGKRNLCKTFLASYGSAKNTKPSYTVLNPQIDREEWPGNWWHSGEGWEIAKGHEWLVQTIRLNYYRDVPFYSSSISADATVQTRQQLGLTTETPEPMVAVDGQAKSQQISINREDGSQVLHTTTDTGIAQTNVTTAKSADATVVTTEKTVQTTPLSDTTPVAGTIRRIINAASRYFNRYNTTEVVDTGIAQTNVTTAKSADATVVTTEKTVQTTPLSDTTPTAGTIRRIINAASRYFNRYNTTEMVDTGIAQTNVIKLISPAGINTTTENTVQTSPLAYPSATKGYIYRIINRMSRYFSRYDTVQEVEQPTDQVATSGEDGGLSSSVRTTHTENPNTPTVPPSSSQGNIKTVDASPTRAGNLATAETTKSSKPKSVPEFVSHIGEKETRYESEEYHALTPPAITTPPVGTELSIVGHDLDDFLTHNYRKIRTVKTLLYPNEVSWVTFGRYEVVTSQVWSATLGRYWNDHSYVYQLREAHTMKSFRTPTEAQAYIAGVFLTDNSGSDWYRAGEYEYIGHKIVHTKSLVTTYNYLEPLS